MKNKSTNNKNIIVFLLLVFLFILSSVYFVHILRSDYRSGQLKVHRVNKEPVSMQIVNIRTWMTFDYINVVFKLPSNYFKNKLSITDLRYPNIRIDDYAKNSGINKVELLSNIKQLLNQNINKGI